MVRKHYAKWSKPRQDRIDGLMLDNAGGVRQDEAEQEGGYSLDTNKGSPQEFVESGILRGLPGFLKSDVFGVGHGHALRFQ